MRDCRKFWNRSYSPIGIRLIPPEPGLPAIKRPSSGSMSSSRRLASPMDAVMAQTLCTYLDEVERIERMIAGAEARRGAILYEVELHRRRRRLWRATRQARLEIERHRG